MKIRVAIIVFVVSFASFAQSVEPRAAVGIAVPGSARAGRDFKIRLTLRNVGTVPFYVVKGFGPFGGGIPGFVHAVTQLAGRRPHTACGIAGDGFPKKETRSAEQILAEDYLLLWPGQFVGYEATVQPCTGPQYTGTYRFTASWHGRAIKEDDFKVEKPKYPFVTEAEAKPVVVRLK